jgi:cytoskeletal protein CcmA (bactofilin family)
MFGRRDPDRPSDNQTMPLKSDLDLDMLDDLPDILPDEPAKPATPATPPVAPANAEQAPDDPAWQAAAPAMLGPSVTQLLREAEAAPQRPADEEVPSLFEPAPAITTQFSYIPAAQPEAEPIIEAEPASAAPAYPFPAPEPSPAAPVIEEPVAPPALAAPAAASVDRARIVAESVIGTDDFFDGRYRSERGVRIQGNARGSIESRQYIYVEAGAQVEADLSAEEITIAGDFTGKIACRGRLEVTSSGKIQGHVETALLVVQEGGAIDGELNMRGHDAAEAARAAGE